MKYIELEKDERKVLNEVERGVWRSVASTANASQYQKYVRASLKKTKNTNIRLSEDVLLRLRAKALHEGIPYQTYIASLVHKHVRADWSSKATMVVQTNGEK